MSAMIDIVVLGRFRDKFAFAAVIDHMYAIIGTMGARCLLTYWMPSYCLPILVARASAELPPFITNKRDTVCIDADPVEYICVP